MQHLNTLSQIVDAASTVVELARSSQTYSFGVMVSTTCYVHVAGGEVRIARHTAPLVEIVSQLQAPFRLARRRRAGCGRRLFCRAASCRHRRNVGCGLSYHRPAGCPSRSQAGTCPPQPRKRRWLVGAFPANRQLQHRPQIEFFKVYFSHTAYLTLAEQKFDNKMSTRNFRKQGDL